MTDDVVTYVIELGVGLASIALGWSAWRRGGSFRAVGAVLVAAGVVAVVHALTELVG